MSKIQGVVVAKVADRNALGQILVKYPWLTGDEQGYWAPVATTMGGGSRGSWFMPERTLLFGFALMISFRLWK